MWRVLNWEILAQQVLKFQLLVHGFLVRHFGVAFYFCAGITAFLYCCQQLVVCLFVQIRKLSRWEVIHVVRTMSTEAAKSGEEGVTWLKELQLYSHVIVTLCFAVTLCFLVTFSHVSFWALYHKNNNERFNSFWNHSLLNREDLALASFS